MRTLVLEAPHRLTLRDTAEVRPRSDEVLVRVDWSGICGTDVHGYVHGEPLRSMPIVMGHEFSGTVVDTGQRVVVNPRVVCGTCEHCREGRTQLCVDATTVGVHRPGGFAEYVAVPADNCVALPDDLDERLAALAEPLAVGLHGANTLAEQRELDGLRVGIIGGGLIGLSLALVARARGADISLADLSPHRRQQAQRHGIEEVGESLGGTFDATVEAVGHHTARAASLERLQAGGVTLWIGLDAAHAELDIPFLVRGERSITTSYCYTTEEFIDAVELCREFDADELEYASLDDGAAVFERLHSGPGSASARTLFAVGQDRP